MNLGELKAWVIRTVKRPEKAADIVDAINSAIEFAAANGDFAWDLVEGTVDIDSSLYAQNIVISSAFTRFRKIKYLRPSGYTRYINWRDPSRIFDNKGLENVDCWYRAGDNIIFKLSNLQSAMLYGYYSYPARLSASSSTNAYTEQMTTTIHALACAYIYEDIGNEAEAARLTARGMKFLEVHKADKQDGVSYS